MNTIRSKDVIYRSIGDDFSEGVIACGYMPKPTSESSQFHFVTGYYSGFIVLSGTGTYIEEDGTHIPMTPGCFVQRFPGRVHSTRIDPDGQWLEFFVCFGKSVYDALKRLNILPAEPVIHSACDITDFSPFDHFMEQLKTISLDQLYTLLPDIQKLTLAMSRRIAAPEDTLSAEASENANVISSIKKGCIILSSDFSGDIDLETLAGSLNMSYESFRKIFKKQTGVSSSRYRSQQRIRHSQLLLSSGMSIK